MNFTDCLNSVFNLTTEFIKDELGGSMPQISNEEEFNKLKSLLIEAVEGLCYEQLF